MEDQSVQQESEVYIQPRKQSRFIEYLHKPHYRLALAVIAAFGVVLLLLFYYFFLQHQNTVTKVLTAENSSLHVIRTFTTGSPINAINIHFNEEVDPHSLTHHFYITPDIPGTFESTSNPKIVRYTFTEKPPTGVSIYFHIPEGLVSKNNKTLLAEYRNAVYIPYVNKTPRLATNTGIAGKVMSFPANKPFELQLAGSGDYSDIKVHLYRSNAFNLLQFLSYTITDPSDYPGSRHYDGRYLHESVDHTEADKIKTLSVSEDHTISINVEPGVYYLKTPSDVAFLVANSFGVNMRQDDKKVVFGAFDINSGNKITDKITFGLYNLENGVNILKNHIYSEAENSTSLQYPSRLDAVIAIKNNEVAFIPVEVPNSMADISVTSDLDKDYELFVYTDRPIYKPKDTVYVRGILRRDSDSLYQLPVTGTRVYLRMGSGADQIKQNVAVDEYGTFAAQFIIPEDMKYGGISVSTEADDKRYYYGATAYANFDIAQYVKPKFEITTQAVQAEYIRSDKLKFTITGRYFNNQPLSGEKLTYSVYTQNYYETEKAIYNENFNITSQGGMCGGGGVGEWYGNEYVKNQIVTLDADGKAVIEVDAEEETILSQKITLVAKKKDSSGNEIVSAANSIVHAAEFNTFFIPSADTYKPDEEVVAPFYAEKLNGDKIDKSEFEYHLVEYTYNNKTTLEKAVVSGKVDTDDRGKGIIKFKVPDDLKEGQYTLSTKRKDTKGNISENRKTITIQKETLNDNNRSWWYQRISQTYLKITSAQNSYQVGDKVTLSVVSPKDLDVLVSLERGRVYQPRFIRLNKGENIVTIDVSSELSPSITVVFSFFADGKYYTEGLSLNVPAMHKILQVALKTDKNTYEPNDTAIITVSTKDAKGIPVPAQLSLGIVDKAIYALRENATPKIHTAFYYFRPRRTNASSSLTWVTEFGGGGGGGGGGGELFGSKADTLYWNPDIRTDLKGEASVSVPLQGHSTIWKAQVIGSTANSEVGQASAEFLVSPHVLGTKKKRTIRW